MGTQVKVELSPDQILKTRGLQVGGPAQRFFTGEFRRKMDPYVPFLTGVLKDTAIENVDSIQHKSNITRTKGMDFVAKNGIKDVGQTMEIRLFSLLQIL